uniref:Uncharacterized protein n=1 Tax=Arundo donax TaxID=35708 RepID=A0A0A9G9V9_ARUDO
MPPLNSASAHNGCNKANVLPPSKLSKQVGPSVILTIIWKIWCLHNNLDFNAQEDSRCEILQFISNAITLLVTLFLQWNP